MFPFRARDIVVCMAALAGVATGAIAHAQEQNSVPSGPAPVLVTVSETPKPGTEAAHAELEAEYAAALDAGHGSQYYLGMGAITGTPRTVFLSGYSSLEEMADVHNQDEANLGDKLSSLDEEHSGTLAGEDTEVWQFRPSLSNSGSVNLGQMRFMELIRIHVKLGHSAEFAEIVKQIRAGWMKADPDFHYSIYQQIYGDSKDDSYLVTIPVESLADLDKHHAMVAKYQKSVGEDVEKRMLDFESADYDSTETNLFAFTPSMSRLPASWTKDDANFWKPNVSAPANTPAKTK